MSPRILTISFILSLFSQTLQAKEKDATVQPIVTDTIIGGTTNQPIIARQYEFPANVVDFNLDAEKNNVLLVLRKNKSTGSMGLYDLNKEQLNWSKGIGYFNLKYFGSAFFYQSPNTNLVYDRLTGEKLYWTNYVYYFIEPKTGYGMARSLSAVDVAQHKTVWNRNIDLTYGISDSLYVNDSTMLMVGGDLSLINLKTGEGWNYKLKTTKEDYRNMWKGLAIGMTTAAITGVAIVPGSTTQTLFGLGSNVLLDNDRIYVADANQLTCLDMNGKPIWETDLPKHTGSSGIFMANDAVYIVNKGTVNYENATVTGTGNYGRPYFAAIDKASGKQQFMETFEKIDGRGSYTLRHDTAVLCLGEKVFMLGLKDGKKLAEEKMVMSPNLEFTDVDGYFICNNSGSYVPLARQYEGGYFFKSEIGNIVVYDRYLKASFIFRPFDLYQAKGTYGSYQCLQNNNGRMVLTKGKEMVAELNVSPKTVVANNKIYTSADGKLQIITIPED